MICFPVSFGHCIKHFLAREFGARKQGPFIIHRTVRDKHTGWAILHTDTGYTVAFNFRSRSAARDCAHELYEIAGERWRFSEPWQWATSITDLDRDVMALKVSEYLGAVYRSGANQQEKCCAGEVGDE